MPEIFDMPPRPARWEVRGGWVAKALSIDLKIPLIAAAAIAGNCGFESNGFETLQEKGVPPPHGGYGWPQWTGPRRRAYEAWCAGPSRIDPALDVSNYRYLVAEIRRDFPTLLANMRNIATLENAVFHWGRYFENPAGTTITHLPGYDERLSYARRALAGAGGMEGDTASAPRDTLRELQTVLQKAGDYAGALDGLWGDMSQAALDALLARAGQ